MLSVETLSTQGVGQKMVKICPRSCWMTSKQSIKKIVGVSRIDTVWHWLNYTTTSDFNTSKYTQMIPIGYSCDIPTYLVTLYLLS